MASGNDSLPRYRLVQNHTRPVLPRLSVPSSRAWRRPGNFKLGVVGALAVFGAFSLFSFSSDGDWPNEPGIYVEIANADGNEPGVMEMAEYESSSFVSSSKGTSSWEVASTQAATLEPMKSRQAVTVGLAQLGIEPTDTYPELGISSHTFHEHLEELSLAKLTSVSTWAGESTIALPTAIVVTSPDTLSVLTFHEPTVDYPPTSTISGPTEMGTVEVSLSNPMEGVEAYESARYAEFIDVKSSGTRTVDLATITPSHVAFAQTSLSSPPYLEMEPDENHFTDVHKPIILPNFNREKSSPTSAIGDDEIRDIYKPILEDVLDNYDYHQSEFIHVDSGDLHFVGRWVHSDSTGAMIPTFPGDMVPQNPKLNLRLSANMISLAASYVEIEHNSSDISIALSQEPGATYTTILYAYSVGDDVVVYQPMIGVGPGTILLPRDKSIKTMDPKRVRTRIVFPLGDFEISSLGLKGIFLEKQHQTGNPLPKQLSQMPQPIRKTMSTRQSDTPKRIIEVVTDSLWGDFGMGFTASNQSYDHSITDPLSHWGWLLAERYEADIRLIGVDGMCIASPCLGLQYTEDALGQLYFRAGPPGSRYFRQKWDFSSQSRPDVIILNVGQADSLSLLNMQAATYDNGTASAVWKNRFEDAMVDFVRAIRQRAYPTNFGPSSGLEDMDQEIPLISTVTAHHQVVPIYIIPPFHNRAMIQVIRDAIRRVITSHDEGYHGISECCIYDVDVSTWMSAADGSLDTWVFHPTFPDQFRPAAIETSRLTRMGHTRAATYLESRLCRYLALNPRIDCPHLGEGEVGGMMEYKVLTDNADRSLIEKEAKSLKEKRLKGAFIW